MSKCKFLHHDATSGVTILGTGSSVRLSLPDDDWILWTAMAAVGLKPPIRTPQRTAISTGHRAV